MLVFSAITPHPPILIPTIGKKNLEKITKTKEAMEQLAEELYALQPDTIVVISPHGLVQTDTFTIQISEKYYGEFQNFGDLETKFEFEPDISFINKIKIRAELKNLPVQLVNESFIDHGTLVPLYYLAQNLPNVKIVPIAYSMLNYQDHFEFGKYLKKVIGRSNKRIALIASGDLSHCLSKDAPAKYCPKGEVFDKQVIDMLQNKKCGGLMMMDKELAEEAKECGLRSILTLAGVIDEMNCEPQLLSYEAPFGVGYLVMNFKTL